MAMVWPFPRGDGPFLGRTGPKSAERQWRNLHPPTHHGWDGCSRLWWADAYLRPSSFSHAPFLSWRHPNHCPTNILSPCGPPMVRWWRQAGGEGHHWVSTSARTLEKDHTDPGEEQQSRVMGMVWRSLCRLPLLGSALRFGVLR